MNRHIRVFISSTFQDMNEEREYLRTEIFPQFTRECRKKGVIFTPIDLRWGVDESDAANQRTIEICLDEIKKSSETPAFFIGLIGDRYGWIPNVLDVNKYLASVNAKYKDIVKKSVEEHLSVTELEFKFSESLKNSHSDEIFSYFYIRSNQKNHFTEIEDTDALERLVKFKEWVSNNNSLQINGYKSLESLGENILTNLKTVLNGFSDKYDEEHENTVFKTTRIEGAIKTPLEDKLIKEVSSRLSKVSQPIAIFGESGSGKSTLCSRLDEHFKDNDIKTFTFFCGVSGCNNVDDLLRAICKKTALEKTITLGSSLDSLTDNLSNIFIQKENDYKYVLIIDAIDQLEFISKNYTPKDVAERLLEINLPDNTQLVFSFRGQLDHQTNSYRLLPFSQEDVEKCVRLYCNTNGKKIADEVISLISESENYSNPLALRILLNAITNISNNIDSKLANYDVIRFIRSHKSTKIDELIRSSFDLIAHDLNHICNKDKDKDKDKYANAYPSNVGLFRHSSKKYPLIHNLFEILYYTRSGVTYSELLNIFNKHINALGFKFHLNELELTVLLSRLEPFLLITNGRYKVGHMKFQDFSALEIPDDWSKYSKDDRFRSRKIPISEFFFDQLSDSDVTDRLNFYKKNSFRSFFFLGGTTFGKLAFGPVVNLLNDKLYLESILSLQPGSIDLLLWFRYLLPSKYEKFTTNIVSLIETMGINENIATEFALNRGILNEHPILSLNILHYFDKNSSKRGQLFSHELMLRFNYSYHYLIELYLQISRLSFVRSVYSNKYLRSSCKDFIKSGFPDNQISYDHFMRGLVAYSSLHLVRVAICDSAFEEDEFYSQVGSKLNMSREDPFVYRNLFSIGFDDDELTNDELTNDELTNDELTTRLLLRTEKRKLKKFLTTYKKDTGKELPLLLKKIYEVVHDYL